MDSFTPPRPNSSARCQPRGSRSPEVSISPNTRPAYFVGELEDPPNIGVPPTARCCGARRHRQTNSVRVCSPASRRFASLRPPLRGASGPDAGSAHARPDWLLLTMPAHTTPTCCGRPSAPESIISQCSLTYFPGRPRLDVWLHGRPREDAPLAAIQPSSMAKAGWRRAPGRPVAVAASGLCSPPNRAHRQTDGPGPHRLWAGARLLVLLGQSASPSPKGAFAEWPMGP